MIAGSTEPAARSWSRFPRWWSRTAPGSRYVLVQDLGRASWHLARLGATVGRDATLASFTAGLGAEYDRCRLDAVALGEGD